MRPRVAVTGLGVVSPIGTGVDAFWSNLCAGRSGVGPVSSFDASPFPTRIAAEVKCFRPPAEANGRRLRRMDRFAQFALAAAMEAWRDSGLAASGLDSFDIGVVIGSTHGGEASAVDQVKRLARSPHHGANPFIIPRMLNSMAAAQVAIALGLRGINFGVSSACATGAQAIGEAAAVIQRGDATALLCGGTEACITPLTLAGDAAAGALSRRNDAPQAASRPFDAHRDGFVLGEGAGVLVLEEMSHATARGSPVYAEVTGYAATSDALHETRSDPGGRSAARAVCRALARAAVAPAQLGAVFAHAAGTPAGDPAEVQALRLALGDEVVASLPAPAIKSMTGHMLGAAGAVQAIAVAKSLRDQRLPPTVNYTTPDPACAVDCVPGRARAASLTHVLSNSFGFGGHNVCLLFSGPAGEG